MSKLMSGFTVPRYRIEAVLGIRIVANQITRNEGKVIYHLGTQLGVTAWCKEQQPFVSLKITDTITKQDVTADFLRELEFVKSRYQGGVDYVNLYSEFGS